MKVFLEEEKMQLSVNKMKLYKNEEDINFDELKTLIYGINSTYSTSNSSKLYNIYSLISNKTRVLSNIHNSNIYVLNTKIRQHLALKRLNSEILGYSDNSKIDIRVK